MNAEESPRDEYLDSMAEIISYENPSLTWKRARRIAESVDRDMRQRLVEGEEPVMTTEQAEIERLRAMLDGVTALNRDLEMTVAELRASIAAALAIPAQDTTGPDMWAARGWNNCRDDFRGALGGQP